MLCGLSLVVVSGGFSCCRAQVLGVSASVVVAHGPGCSMACGIFPDQGLNLCPLHWQVNAYALYYQCVCVLSRVRLRDPWTVTCQVPLFMQFSRQEHCSGLPFLFPGDLSDLGIEPTSLMSPTLAGGFFTNCTTWEVLKCILNL